MGIIRVTAILCQVLRQELDLNPCTCVGAIHPPRPLAFWTQRKVEIILILSLWSTPRQWKRNFCHGWFSPRWTCNYARTPGRKFVWLVGKKCLHKSQLVQEIPLLPTRWLIRFSPTWPGVIAGPSGRKPSDWLLHKSHQHITLKCRVLMQLYILTSMQAAYLHRILKMYLKQKARLSQFSWE